MAISTYGELKTAVANFLKRDDLTERIPEFISLAEDRIGQTLRIRLMEQTSDLTISSATQTVALPTRYVAMRRLYIDGSPVRRLEFRTPVNFWSIYASSETNKPRVFTIEGENIVLGPTPDTSYTGKILFYQRLAAFSSDSDTNTLLTEARGLYLYGALLEAAPFLGNDTRILTWAQFWDDLKERVETADKKDRFSGDALTQQSLVQST